MATAKSDIVTLLDALPKGQVDRKKKDGKVHSSLAVFEAGTGDIDDNDVILMVRVPAEARIESIKLFNDDLDSNGTPTLAANIGLYRAEDGVGLTKGAVIDEDCYATAVATLQAANTAGVEMAFEARDIANAGQEVWQDAGLSAPDAGQYDIAITFSASAATAAAGTIVMMVQYVL